MRRCGGWIGAAVGLVLLAGAGGGAAGCFSRDPIDITSDDPGSKIPAIRRAAREQDQESVRQLVADLESDDPAVRFYAIRALRGLVAQDFGYHYWAPDEQREPAVQRWKQWLADRERQQAQSPAAPAR